MVPVVAAVRKVLVDLPEEVQVSVEAVCALALAESIENQIGGAAAVKELRAIMAVLREKTNVAGDELDDLVARRAARSATTAAG